MEITIKINGRMVSVEVSDEVAECYDQGRRKAENLSHEKRRHWDDREFDEYIVATEGLLSSVPAGDGPAADYERGLCHPAGHDGERRG